MTASPAAEETEGLRGEQHCPRPALGGQSRAEPASSLHRKSVHFSPGPHPLLGTQRRSAPESMYAHGTRTLGEAGPRERDRDTHRDRDRGRKAVPGGPLWTNSFDHLGILGTTGTVSRAGVWRRHPRQSGPRQVPPGSSSSPSLSGLMASL